MSTLPSLLREQRAGGHVFVSLPDETSESAKHDALAALLMHACASNQR